ncbi:MAG: hypothetical protein P8Z80_13760, partial [Pseudolabrys sp.]
MPIFLHGLSLQNYRGIGPETQRLFPFREFNFFIGANNAGKSTVLDFIHRYLHAKSGKVRPTPDGLDLYLGGQRGAPKAAIGIPSETFLSAIELKSPNFKSTIERLTEVLSDEKIVWLTMPFGGDRFDLEKKPTIREIRSARINDSEIQAVWAGQLNAYGGDINGWIGAIYSRVLLGPQNTQFPKVELIPAIREIGPKAEEFSDLSGRGLIDRLAELQSPDHDK